MEKNVLSHLHTVKCRPLMLFQARQKPAILSRFGLFWVRSPVKLR